MTIWIHRAVLLTVIRKHDLFEGLCMEMTSVYLCIFFAAYRILQEERHSEYLLLCEMEQLEEDCKDYSKYHISEVCIKL